MIFKHFLFKYTLVSLVYRAHSFKLTSTTCKHRCDRTRLGVNLGEYLKSRQSYIDTVRGAQCYLPPQQRVQRWLQNKWESESKKFGFQEYAMPVLAHTDMFVDTDTPVDGEHYKELYTFTDRKGRNLSLRGDITPQFMHMLKGLAGDEEKLPSHILKWYTIADCWRYERPSCCRRRNHTQWNADIVGISGLEVEVELLSLLISFFKSLGLSSSDVKIALNHRSLTPEILRLLGVTQYSKEWLYNFGKTLDKFKKTPWVELEGLLRDLHLSQDQCSELYRLVEHTKTLSDLEKIIDDQKLSELKDLLRRLEERGFSDWVEIDLTIIRGNDYYTGIVFECFDRDNLLPRSLAGGGRYDNYFTDSDPRLKYSAGFGMGNIAITTLLKKKNMLPEESSLVDVLVFAPSEGPLSRALTPETQLGEGVESDEETQVEPDPVPSVVGNTHSNQQTKFIHKLMDFLRENDLSVYHYYKTPKVKKALRFADRCMARFFVMPFEKDGRTALLVKNLATKTQEYLDVSDDLARLVLERITHPDL